MNMLDSLAEYRQKMSQTEDHIAVLRDALRNGDHLDRRALAESIESGCSVLKLYVAMTSFLEFAVVATHGVINPDRQDLAA